MSPYTHFWKALEFHIHENLKLAKIPARYFSEDLIYHQGNMFSFLWQRSRMFSADSKRQWKSQQPKNPLYCTMFDLLYVVHWFSINALLPSLKIEPSSVFKHLSLILSSQLVLCPCWVTFFVYFVILVPSFNSLIRWIFTIISLLRSFLWRWNEMYIYDGNLVFGLAVFRS
jgi:hypothetical protein